eukprot:m51a1_g10727 hypothetical protein (201) ;mRNA; f:271776-272614
MAALTPDEQRTALRIAWHALTEAVTHNRRLTAKYIEERFELTPALREARGVFVTLEKGRGAGAKKSLRGCIGYGIAENAANAALEDDRFRAVSAGELGALSVEVSAMTPLERCAQLPGGVVVGTHGLDVALGRRSGLLLPQVAVEWGWGSEEFLEETCLKAGLPRAAWRDPKAVVRRFSAQVFCDDQFPDVRPPAGDPAC